MRLRKLLGRFSALARITTFFCCITRAPPAGKRGNTHKSPHGSDVEGIGEEFGFEYFGTYKFP
jgi:hypothetical protein